MSKFKVGDEVKFVKKTSGYSYSASIGDKLIVTSTEGNRITTNTGEWFFESDLLVINSKPDNMSLITKFKLSLKSEPEKSFIEKGIMTIDERFTAEGKELFDLYIYQQNKAGFKADIVDKIPQDESKN